MLQLFCVFCNVCCFSFPEGSNSTASASALRTPCPLDIPMHQLVDKYKKQVYEKQRNIICKQAYNGHNMGTIWAIGYNGYNMATLDTIHMNTVFHIYVIVCSQCIYACATLCSHVLPYYWRICVSDHIFFQPMRASLCVMPGDDGRTS